MHLNTARTVGMAVAAAVATLLEPTGPSEAAAGTAAFYVCTAGRDSWSGKLAAPNGDQSDGPFATVERAKKAARASSSRQPVLVQIRNGTYFLHETLTFEPEDSGTERAPVIYEAYPGEEAILSGGVLITGWRKVSGNRWETRLPEVADGKWWFSQLWLNDQRRLRPVWPKKGYHFIAGQLAPAGGRQPDQFLFKPGDIRADWHNLRHVEITTFHLWTMDRIPIKAVDDARRIVTLAGPTHSREQAPLAPTTWYRAENVREALTEPGQWYLDRATGVLTYLARPGEDLRRARVIAPRLTRLVEFKGDVEKGAFVEHVTLRGLTLAHTGWNVPEKGYGFFQAEALLDGAVTAVNARRCALENCVIRHTGNYAVDFGAGCRGCRVEGCELFDLGAGGVKIGTFRFNDEPDQRKWSGECVVRDNRIAHGGRLHPAAVGVLIGHAANNVAEHNEVADLYYSGFSVGWRWTKGFSPATNNTIAFNHIHDIGQGVLSDLGGIYTLGESPGTTERFNLIHDARRARYGGWGIYFDAESAGIVGENNVIYRCEDAGFHQNYGSRNTLRNNIFAFGEKAQVQLSNLQKSGPLTFERNIFYWREGKLFTRNPDDEIAFRSNLYWRAGAAEPIRFGAGASLAEWRKREPGAVVADPMFVAPQRGDFRPRPGSPALKAGFIPFDIGNAGRLTRPNRTDKLPPVPRVFPPAPPEPGPGIKDGTLKEDFESLGVGASVPGFMVHVKGDESVTVTDETAAAGKHSLKFTECPPTREAPWTPHIFCRTRFDNGVVRNSFDLRVERGASPQLEWRDWGEMDRPLISGPSLHVQTDGSLVAGGKKLLMLPTGQWVRIEITCGLGKRATGKYSVVVQVPGEGAPRRFDDLACSKGFKVLDWLGFASFGQQKAVYYVDNLRLWRAGP